MESEVFTLAEVARYLRTKPNTISDLLVSGKLAGFNIDGEWRILGAAVLDFPKRNMEDSQLQAMRSVLVDPKTWAREVLKHPEFLRSIENQEFAPNTFGHFLKGGLAALENESKADNDHRSTQKAEITEVTRREIIDRLVAGNWAWAGRLQEDDFLSRLYDLNALPSEDNRFQTAAGDIWQHRVNNLDWEDDWIFFDQRFNLLHAPDEDFLRFLCETVHPVVRPRVEQALELVNTYNGHLRQDGWELVRSSEISGRPVFHARKTAQDIEIFAEPTGWPKVDRQVEELRLRLHEATTEEQFQSVGHLCREALISVAQAVYDRERHPPPDGVEPSATDAKRMLDAFINVELSGAGNSNVRKHARAAFDLANVVQHDRTASFRDAALCAEATVSVIRIVAIVSGRHERTDLSS
jgi:AbiJ N-terminal domain 3/Helix-turn-helix domain